MRAHRRGWEEAPAEDIDVRMSLNEARDLVESFEAYPGLLHDIPLNNLHQCLKSVMEKK